MKSPWTLVLFAFLMLLPPAIATAQTVNPENWSPTWVNPSWERPANMVADGAKVEIVFPDQEPGGLGALVIPNTVAVVAGGPNLEEARRLVDYLLSPQVTADLVEAGWFHVPSRPVDATPPCVDASDVRAMAPPD